MRQVVLDTETTGLSTSDGHKIIEIGCVEIVNRRVTENHYHQYICPQREIDPAAFAVHGISEESLADKPVFSQIIDDLLAYISNAELIIHNAPFDIGFLNYEFSLAGEAFKTVTDYCTVFDTLLFARKRHPGQQNSLDALCRRYSVNNAGRVLHGALLDANLLAEVYLAMTGGQTSLFGEGQQTNVIAEIIAGQQLKAKSAHELKVVYAGVEEQQMHAARLQAIKQVSGKCWWLEE